MKQYKLKTLHEMLNENKQEFSEMMAESMNDNALLEMANLAKSDTSLPMIVWIQVKQETQHNAPRMKFANNYSNNMLPKDLVPISISDDPQILTKRTKLKISNADFEKLRQWIIRNKEELMKVWNGEISTIKFGKIISEKNKGIK